MTRMHVPGFGGGWRARTGLAAGVVAVVVFLGALVGLAVEPARVGRGGATPPRATAQTQPRSEATLAPPTTAATLTPEEPTRAFGLPGYDTVVAYAQVPSIGVYPAPGAAAASTTMANPNNLGAPLVFRVVEVAGPWLQVMLPVRPNGSTGWVRQDDVKLYSDEYSVSVSLSSRTIVVSKAGQVAYQQPVIIGSLSAPTPPGNFYITELLKAPDPNGPYGPYAFGLSDFSNTYSEFEGGPGQIAMHGTNVPQYMGQAISHGCVRLRNEFVAQLAAELPVGSPVVINS